MGGGGGRVVNSALPTPNSLAKAVELMTCSEYKITEESIAVTLLPPRVIWILELKVTNGSLASRGNVEGRTGLHWRLTSTNSRPHKFIECLFSAKVLALTRDSSAISASSSDNTERPLYRRVR